jgi:DNA-binding CsgD family transcriptional regulator
MDDAALGARDGGAASSIERITGASAMGSVTAHWVESCSEELLSISPGRVPSRLDARSRLAAAAATGERAVSRRTIYHQRAVRDRVTQRYLHQLVELGALVRLAECIPARAVIVDRTVALLTVPGQRGPDEQMAVVRDSSLVAWLVVSFEQLWADSMPLAEPTSMQQDIQLAQTQAAILRMLADGEKDEAISRRLSISVRTCRRHIADYMAKVGASSRFQAGVIAATSGYLASPFLGGP